MKAQVKKYGNSLWIDINGEHDDTSWAIEEEELIPIRDAINVYLDSLNKEEE